MNAYHYLVALASSVSALGVLYTIVTKRGSQRKKELHDTMTLWVMDGGGIHIRKIVQDETQVVLRRLEEHELTEPERFRQAWRDIRDEGEDNRG